jgi:hypothetical protein
MYVYVDVMNTVQVYLKAWAEFIVAFYHYHMHFLIQQILAEQIPSYGGSRKYFDGKKGSSHWKLGNNCCIVW